MLHHHAAIGQHGAGLGVLNQAMDYINDYQHFWSSYMDFLVCYYRPDNRFPNRVFGSFARMLDNSQLCSTDSIAYSVLTSINRVSASATLQNKNAITTLQAVFEKCFSHLKMNHRPNMIEVEDCHLKSASTIRIGVC